MCFPKQKNISEQCTVVTFCVAFQLQAFCELRSLNIELMVFKKLDLPDSTALSISILASESP
ncbi:hypothetical protein DPMN_119005 [Dreissena polymorpha]|uniref:Uncharacterized protein n=1 Tax=Dreissena polymorpha TaxID=45954 RepID=A0A9D4GL56_DREPO|nr:hypothetical protein DPMN_119005 [Dreissena polymorpha]